MKPGFWIAMALVLALVVVAQHAPVLAGEAGGSPGEFERLMDMSLEELMMLEVTSVSKHAEPLQEAAAAVYVVTGDEIRRSGYTTMAEVLRLVPGMQVGQIDANLWAVTSRGFNGQFANKLLVLIDGRSVYTPVFGGVYWDTQDVLFEDIERVEIIRGPGATLWGANAVNGVINIITHSAADTHGLYVTGGGGTEERVFGAARYGTALGEDGHLRIHGKYFDRDASVGADGADRFDDWSVLRGGFRYDRQTSANLDVTLQGDLYDGDAGTTYSFPSFESPNQRLVSDQALLHGGNVLGRISQRRGDTSHWQLQFYYDYTKRHDAFLRTTRRTYDAEFHHAIGPHPSWQVLWGLGYRAARIPVENTDYAYDPDQNNKLEGLLSGFIQAEWELAPETLRLTLGSKIEYKSNQGGIDSDLTEVQPNGRLLWLPSPGHTVWGAISKAARTPSSVEKAGEVWLYVIPPDTDENPSPLPVSIHLQGSGDFDSEHLTAYEIGYRFRAPAGLTFDLATFYNDYADKRTFVQGEAEQRSDPVPHVYIPLIFDNEQEAEAYGGELSIRWAAGSGVRLRGSYAYWRLDISDPPEQQIEQVFSEDRICPRHQALLRASIDLTPTIELDLIGRYVDAIEDWDIGAYGELDARLAWWAASTLELSVTGRNLLQDHHAEHGSEIGTPYTEIERGAYLEATWRP